MPDAHIKRIKAPGAPFATRRRRKKGCPCHDYGDCKRHENDTAFAEDFVRFQGIAYQHREVDCQQANQESVVRAMADDNKCQKREWRCKQNKKESVAPQADRKGHKA
jgi:hypothetical protein